MIAESAEASAEEVKPLPIYHGYCGWRCGNAGDVITGPIVERLTGRAYTVMAEPENALLFGSGSLLDGTYPNLVTNRNRLLSSAVWGTGMLFETSLVEVRDEVTVLATRGPLSAARLRNRKVTCFGDPGLLVGRAWQGLLRTPKKYRLGIIPHYIDAQDQRLSIFLRRQRPERDATVIDICAPYLEVLERIAECDNIISSSLHGLIFADSLQVPNAWVVFLEDGEERPRSRLAGGSFKFRDYYAGLGRSEPLPIIFTSAETVDRLCTEVQRRPQIPMTIIDPACDALLTVLRGWLETVEPRDALEVE